MWYTSSSRWWDQVVVDKDYAVTLFPGEGSTLPDLGSCLGTLVVLLAVRLAGLRA